MKTKNREALTAYWGSSEPWRQPRPAGQLSLGEFAYMTRTENPPPPPHLVLASGKCQLVVSRIQYFVFPWKATLGRDKHTNKGVKERTQDMFTRSGWICVWKAG